MLRRKLIYRFAMRRSKAYLRDKYGEEFYGEFKAFSDWKFKEVALAAPNIGRSVFALNFDFCISYIAWYKAFRALGVSIEQSGKNIWDMNELILKAIPKGVMWLFKKQYLHLITSKGKEQQRRSETGELHPYDWKIRGLSISGNKITYEIYECGMIRLATDYDAMGMFPYLCRMDYLLAHYFGCGFERDCTLGDGDECCNCLMVKNQICEWSPEKGFDIRK